VFTVVGLPSPSQSTIEGRRAQTVLEVLRAYGILEPSFSLGDAEDQLEPSLRIEAAPRRL
jgi:hypothetical protein